ncbi:MAG: rRNA maturation RNase YbeY [Candidatus Dasytiphilus stammeri]
MRVKIQIACNKNHSRLPTIANFKKWIHAISMQNNKEITIRLVDKNEIQALNFCYRGINRPTNILSFPFDKNSNINNFPLLGDIVICSSLLEEEAKKQHKYLLAHWAHIVIHGILHLLGYNHIHDDEAKQMELIETKIMLKLGFPDPYLLS